MIRTLRRVVVGTPASADVPPKPATVLHQAHQIAGGSTFDPAPSGLRKLTRSSAAELTAADFSLEPGPQPIASKAVVSDAIELLRESGVGLMQASTTASTRLGYPLPADLDSGQPATFFDSLGPAALPIVDAWHAPGALSTWRLDARTVVPEILERSHGAPDVGLSLLSALAKNPHLSDDQLVAVQDAVVRSAKEGATQAPVFDELMTLDRLVADVTSLGQGEVFAESLPVVSGLIKRGATFTAANVAKLADRALLSADPATRAHGGSLFWHSSNTSEAALKTYLKSVFEHTADWSPAVREQTLEQFRTDPTWAYPPGQGKNQLWNNLSGIALANVLNSAPAAAEILPAVAASQWPHSNDNPKLNLVSRALAALAWSTLAPERLIAAADTIDEGVSSPTHRGDVLAQLIKKHPQLGHLAPQMIRALSGRHFPLERLLQADDFLGEVRAMRGELEALPLSTEPSKSEAKRFRAHSLSRFDRLIEGPTKASVLKWLSEDLTNHWQELVAVEQGKELGLFAQEMLEPLMSRGRRSAPAVTAAAQLLSDASIPTPVFQKHFAEVLKAAPKGEVRVKLLEALQRHAATKADLVDMLSPSLATSDEARHLSDDLVAAGFSHSLASAFAVAGKEGQPYSPSMRVAFAPSSELPRGMHEALEARLADFRQRAASEAPFELFVGPSRPGREPPSFFEQTAPKLFDGGVQTPESLAALDGFNENREANLFRLIIDLRNEVPYAQLREKYGPHTGPNFDVLFNWAYADDAPPSEKLAVLMSGTLTPWHGAMAALATPSLTPAQKERVILSAFTRPKLGNGYGPDWPTGIAALLQTFEGSLDFIAPTLAGAARGGYLDKHVLFALGPLLSSPKMSKSVALDVVWRLAEQSNPMSSLGKGADFGIYKAESAAATFYLMEQFIEGRADLTEAEKAHLKGARGVLVKATRFLGQSSR